MSKNKLFNLSAKKFGFTIIEVLVAVTVIGIISAISFVSYGQYNSKTIETQIKSDLENASSALEAYRNFNNNYPLDISTLTTFKTSSNVTLSGGGSADGKTFCIQATSTKNASIVYHISSSENNQNVVAGECAVASGPAAPSAPITTVTLNGANVQATIATLTCTTGTIQYGVRSRTDDGTWSSYSAWNTTLTFTQAANDGVKYGYQAQARCYVDAVSYSTTVEGTESTYIDPIPAPSAPVVTSNTVTDTTTWSWPAVTCAVGTARYQYDYTISPSGYDSGWTSNGANLNVAFTTSTAGQTYTVYVQAQCYNSNTSSNWSDSSTVVNYYKSFAWKQLSAGNAHTCAISNSNKAYCWGYNVNGQLGNNSTTDSWVPVPVYDGGVLNGKTIKQVATGFLSSCAIASDDLVYCWGINTYGQLGDNSVTESHVPVAVNMTNGVSALYGKTAKFIAYDYQHVCVIASDDLVYCWGLNTRGQMGDNSAVSKYVPTAVNMANGVSALYGKTVKALSVATYHSCVIASDDLPYCWGRGAAGNLGNNGTSQINYPVAVNMANGVSALYGKTVKQISTGAGGEHVCVIASDDLPYCWGWNNTGQIGDNSTTTRLVPVAVNRTNGVSSLYNKTAKYISTSYRHSCVIANDDLLNCWGENLDGRLGNNSLTDSWIPVATNMANGVSALYGKTIKYLDTGSYFTCVIASDDKVYCWGYNNVGQLGNNSTATSRVPTLINEP